MSKYSQLHNPSKYIDCMFLFSVRGPFDKNECFMHAFSVLRAPTDATAVGGSGSLCLSLYLIGRLYISLQPILLLKYLKGLVRIRQVKVI